MTVQAALVCEAGGGRDIGDGMTGFEQAAGPADAVQRPVVLALAVDDAEAVFAQAVSAGAEVRQPLAEAFWGERHGQLEDPFGHRWNVAQHLRDVPHDEVVVAAAWAFS